MVSVTALLTAALAVVAACALCEEANVSGIDIGLNYEARVRSGIERHRKSNATIIVTSATGERIAGADVSVKQVSSDFLFGCAFPMWTQPPPHLGSEGWANWERYFTRLFNFATTENSIKWGPMEPEEGKPRWESADFIARWCREHSVKLKGHNLIWDAGSHGTPDWVFKYPPEKIGEIAHNRIATVIARYKNDIPVWDVVNEPWHGRGLETKWDKDYVVLSYKWAREADPGATLVINDFSAFTKIGDQYTEYVKDLLRKGAPIDVIAEQIHDVPHWYSPKEILGTLDKMATTGLDIHLTELTYPSDGGPITGGFMDGTWTEEKQAEFYRYLMTLSFSHPRVKAITLWAMWDGSTWLKKGGIIRQDWTPKPAYEVLDDLINNKWRTRLDRKSDVNGKVAFRGFHGMYEIAVTMPSGEKRKATLHVAPGQDNVLRVAIR